MPMPTINAITETSESPNYEDCEANALGVQDPLQKYDLTTRARKLDINLEQNMDADLRIVKRWMRNKEIPETKYENTELKTYHRQLSTLYLTEAGILFRKFYKHNGRDYDRQIVVPKHRRTEILIRLHHPKTEGHQGHQEAHRGVPKTLLLAEFP